MSAGLDTSLLCWKASSSVPDSNSELRIDAGVNSRSLAPPDEASTTPGAVSTTDITTSFPELDSDALFLVVLESDPELRESEESDAPSGCGELSLELGGVLELLRRREVLLDLLFFEKNHLPDKLELERFLELESPRAISSASARVRERELFSVLRLPPVALAEEVRGERWFRMFTGGRSLRRKLR